MSAPVTERARATTRSRTATIPAQRGAPVQARPGRNATEPAGGRRSAQLKAYARRDDRLRRIVGGRSSASGRPQFVLLIMVLLAVGLVATLWLSTAAAADSYRLKDATAEARALSEQAERLHREVAVLASAPELARRATALGMTPVQDPARLVVAPGGSVSVVGEPRAAVAAPPPAPPAQPVPPGPAAPPAAGQPQPDGPEEGTAADATAPDAGGTAHLAAPDRDATDDTAGPAVDGGTAAPDTPEGAGESEPATGDGTTDPDAGTPGERGQGESAQSRDGGATGDRTDSAGPDGGGTDAG